MTQTSAIFWALDPLQAWSIPPPHNRRTAVDEPLGNAQAPTDERPASPIRNVPLPDGHPAALAASAASHNDGRPRRSRCPRTPA